MPSPIIVKSAAKFVSNTGRARLAPVRLGGRNALDAWVLDGLADGAQLIVYPSNEVRDGIRVRVREVARPL